MQLIFYTLLKTMRKITIILKSTQENLFNLLFTIYYLPFIGILEGLSEERRGGPACRTVPLN